MASQTVTVDDRQLRAALNRSAKGLQPDVREALRQSGVAITRRVRERLTGYRKVDTGRYRDSIRAIISDRRGRIELEVGPPPEFEILGLTLENGRRPGSKMPPPGALLPWMARHGIAPSSEFVVRRGIARNGMRGQPFPHMAPAFEDSRPDIDAAFDAVMNKLERNFYG